LRCADRGTSSSRRIGPLSLVVCAFDPCAEQRPPPAHDILVALIDSLGGKIMKKVLVVFAIALTAALLAWSQTSSEHPTKSPLEGTWEMVSGQQLPKGTRDIKIVSGGHFVWVMYDTEKGKPIYIGGGTYTLNGTSYTEHVDFMSEEISAGIVSKDQPFTVKGGRRHTHSNRCSLKWRKSVGNLEAGQLIRLQIRVQHRPLRSQCSPLSLKGTERHEARSGSWYTSLLLSSWKRAPNSRHAAGSAIARCSDPLSWNWPPTGQGSRFHPGS